MHAITLHQPWASLIAAGIKDKETRSWAPPKALIGQRIAIHAALRRPSKLLYPVKDGSAYGFLDVQDMPRGAVVATARLQAAYQICGKDECFLYAPCCKACEDLTECHRELYEPDDYGDYSVGRWVWFLEDVQPLEEPMPAKGGQKFWWWDGD